MANPTNKKHAKVEALKTKRQASIDALHARGGSPIYAPDVMAAKRRDIEAAYDAALVALMDDAQARYDDAEARLAELDQPYDWLTADELARAATLAPFIREDLAQLDAAGLAAAVQSAAGRGRVEKWLTWRYAPRRREELDSDVRTALQFGRRERYEQDMAALREDIMLPSQLKELKTAQQELDDARTQYETAEWARPGERAAVAAKWGVNPEYLPD